MLVDLGNSLASVADPGVSRDSLDRLDRQVADAHERIQSARSAGEFGYTALDLPAETSAKEIQTAVEPFADVSAILTIGIGGSALGAKTITHALNTAIPHYTLDNVDPTYAQRLIEELPLEQTVVNVVSRSGTTTETHANFLVVRDAFTTAGVEWTDRTIISTGESGPLRDLAEAHGVTVLDLPVGVPGRYSAISVAGLVPAALQGHDISELLAGAADEAEHLSGSLFECPSYAYGAITDALSRRGITTIAFMPYVERLEPFAEWFAQLWAESLGKDRTGQTPVRALGTTDQHSQLQLYQDGPPNTLVTLLRPRSRTDYPIPPSNTPGFSYLNDTTLGELNDAEFEATEASLARAGCPTVRIEITELDERGLGELLYGMEAACILAGELKGVNQFDQPAVDWGKQATRGLLGSTTPPREHRIQGKTTLTIGD